MTRFLLVHGAFHGAWCWEEIVSGLTEAGHDAEAFDLPSHGADPTPPAQVTLDDYAARICEHTQTGAPPIVVGHSMGGMAITQAAGRCHDRMQGLVYVAAFLPEQGQSLIDLTQLPEAAGDQVQANQVIEPPTTHIPVEKAPEIFYNCTPPDVALEASRRIGPQAVGPFQDRVDRGSGYDRLPRAYIRCLQDRCVLPALQRRMSTTTACKPVIEIDTDHSPMLSCPEELTEALLRIAAAWEH